MEKLLGLDLPLHWEDWHGIKGWYRAAVDCALPPAQVTVERITVERRDIYSYMTRLGENIPVSVDPFLVDDLETTEDDTDWAVTCLQSHLSGGTSWMRAEHLKGWLSEARKKEKEEAV